jgi:septum formation protein
MLEILSDNEHFVYSGLSLINYKLKKSFIGYQTTRITFNHISKKELINYVTKFNPLDKAGGYGIQEIPRHFIFSIKGSYCNVVGFPLELFLDYAPHFNMITPNTINIQYSDKCYSC